MGGCSSSSDDAEIPRATSHSLENKFKSIEYRTFAVPA